MKEILGLIAVGLSLTGLIPYIIDILRSKTKPHVYTWAIWAIVTSLVFFGQWAKGGGAGSWNTGVVAMLTVVIAILALKKGTDDITKLDKILFVGALLAIVPWLITKDPTLSVVTLTLIDVAAFIPTIRKTLNSPTSETFTTYLSSVFRYVISLVALANYNLATYFFPVTILLMNIVMVGIILKARHKS